MSWIWVVGIKVVVDAEKKYGELVDVCIPRPLKTSRDSSVAISTIVDFVCRTLRPYLYICALCKDRK